MFVIKYLGLVLDFIGPRAALHPPDLLCKISIFVTSLECDRIIRIDCIVFCVEHHLGCFVVDNIGACAENRHFFYLRRETVELDGTDVRGI